MTTMVKSERFEYVWMDGFEAVSVCIGTVTSDLRAIKMMN